MASQKIKILIVAACLLALALIVPYSGSFVILLATRALAFAILAMSVDLLLGFTGLSSMGQAAYFGVGAYLTAVLATKLHFGLGWDFWLVVLMGIAIGVAVLATSGAVLASSFGPWSGAVRVESLPGTHPDFNGPALDGCPFISRDGKSFFMASTRPGGLGGIEHTQVLRPDADEDVGGQWLATKRNDG